MSVVARYPSSILPQSCGRFAHTWGRQSNWDVNRGRFLFDGMFLSSIRVARILLTIF